MWRCFECGRYARKPSTKQRCAHTKTRSESPPDRSTFDNGFARNDQPAGHSLRLLGVVNPCYNVNRYMTLACFNQVDGTVYVEPGIQIYEDPDPQASPGIVDTAFSANGILPQVYEQPDPYPWPSMYVGTCGVVLGGGPSSEPTYLTLPGTNASGQYVHQTGCG
jgi:hypothetical protein